MTNFFDSETREKMMRNAGINEDRMGKYLKEEKKIPVEKKPVAKKLDESKKQTPRKETLEEMKANFKKEMLKMIDEAFDPNKPEEEDPDGLPPAEGGDLAPAAPPAEGGDLAPAAPEGDMGLGGDELGLGDEGGMDVGGGDAESLKTEIKDKFAELATKLGEEEKNTFANELMEILFPGSTTEISDESGLGGEEDLGGGLEDAPEMGDEEDELDDDDLL